MLAFDIALRRNDEHWIERLPEEIDRHLALKIYYGHFFCHVFHQDYTLNVGHLYEAKPALREFYKHCDPTNSFNPGIGGMPKEKQYVASAATPDQATRQVSPGFPRTDNPSRERSAAR